MNMKNEFEIRGEVTAIFISSKYGIMETLISTEQLESVQKFPNLWFAVYNKSTKSFYAMGKLTVASGRQKQFGIHRWIMKFPTGKEIDHINHDTLDNRNENLRVATASDNQLNRKGPNSNSTSRVLGVVWHKHSNSWNVQLRIKGKKLSFGYFKDIEEGNASIGGGQAKVPSGV